MAQRRALQTRYTPRRVTASIMKDLMNNFHENRPTVEFERGAPLWLGAR